MQSMRFSVRIAIEEETLHPPRAEIGKQHVFRGPSPAKRKLGLALSAAART
jgi:hypothetical protein